MQAKVRTEGNVFVIHLSGKVDFDSSEPFRNTMMNHIKGAQVVFNMKDLSFVGSNGITPFVETMRDLCGGGDTEVRFCHLSSEFERIFEANNVAVGINFENEIQAVRSLIIQPVQSMPAFEEPK